MKKLYLLFFLIPSLFSAYSQPFNNFLTLDGVDDYVSNPSVNFYNQGDFTIELFINPCTIGSTSYLIDSRGSTAGDGFELILIYNGANYDLRLQADSSSSSSSTTVSLPDFENKWSHIALTFDDLNNVFEIYYNGDSIGSLNNPYKPSTRIYISRRDYTVSGYFGGFVDELRVSDTIRYSANFNVPSQEFGFDANTVALYHFNDPSNVTQLMDGLGANHLTAYMGANTIEPVIVTPVSPICYGENVTLNAVGANSLFIWTPSAGLSDSTVYNPTATPIITTTYYAQSLDSNSCYISDSVNVVVNQLPVINLADTNVCDNNLPYIANAGNFASFLWNTSATTNTIDIASSGTYSVTVTDNNSCINSNSFNVQIITCTGIDKVKGDKLSIYPNPNNGKFTIESVYKIDKIEIYNIEGKLLFANSTLSNILDISELENGIYILMIERNSSKVYNKIIKQ